MFSLNMSPRMTEKSHPLLSPENPLLHPSWPEALPPTRLRPVDPLEQLAHVRSHLLEHRHDAVASHTRAAAEVPAGTASSRTGRGRAGGNGNYVFVFSPARGAMKVWGGSGGCCHAFRLPRDFFPAAQLARAHTLYPSRTNGARKDLV